MEEIIVRFTVIGAVELQILEQSKYILEVKQTKNLLMSRILAPIENQPDYKPRDNQAKRNGDWVCLNCNNLNFSFRKRCNRCKTQTRQQNDHSLLYAYQYYEQYYQGEDFQDFNLYGQQFSQPLPQYSSPQYFQNQKQQILSLQCLQTHTDLPSVSPLIKRYHSSEKSQRKSSLTKTSDQESSGEEEQISVGKEFLQQYCWQNILMQQEYQSDLSNPYNDTDMDFEIEKLVKNIVV